MTQASKNNSKSEKSKVDSQEAKKNTIGDKSTLEPKSTQQKNESIAKLKLVKHAEVEFEGEDEVQEKNVQQDDEVENVVPGVTEAKAVEVVDSDSSTSTLILEENSP